MKNIDWEILASHLTGQTSEDEERKLARWLAEAPEHRDFLDRLKKAWSAELPSTVRFDTEAALRQVLSRIEEVPAALRPADRRTPVFSIKQRALEFIGRPIIIRAAAALVIALGAYAVYTALRSEREVATTSVTFTSVKTLQLGDGTRITFDVGSSFTCPETFGDLPVREVSLDGEAYFEVARDVEHPFIIRAHGGTITVLGTSFSVRSWKADEHIVVAVKEGRVAIEPEVKGDVGTIVELSDNTASRLSRTSNIPSPPEKIEFDRFVSWMKREIYFQNTSVSEVLHQIERWYGVSFQMADSTMMREKITVFISNKPLGENLEVLSTILNARAEQKGDTVRIAPR
jgi:ferric-dicitrate binding protein FerR (iron transport regulator)